MNDFTPPLLLRSSHLQTVWGRMTRPRRLVPMTREVLVTPDDDDLVLDHLAGPPRDPSLHFILMHGLEGSSNSVYMQGILSVIARHGFGATAINFRSCARDPLDVGRMLPNRRPRFYHSGETSDFDFAIRTLSAREPNTTFVAAGVSLGGNSLLKWLGEHRGQRLVKAAAVLSVPFDLDEGGSNLERGINRLYVSGFLKTLKPKVQRVTAQFPGVRDRIDVDRTMRSQTFREFDDAATAPLHGMRDADDYYGTCSSIHFIGAIDTPALCVTAADDPFVPPSVITRARTAASSSIDFRVTQHGGHAGFIAAGGPRYWAEELVVNWLITEERRRPAGWSAAGSAATRA